MLNFLTITEKALDIYEDLQINDKNSATVTPIRRRANSGSVFYKIKLWWERRVAEKVDKEIVKILLPVFKKRLLKTRSWIRF